MKIIFQFFTHTPVYVYFALVYLLYVGIKGARKRKVSFFRIFFVPAIIIYISMSNVIKLQMEGYLYLVFLFIVGFFASLGWFLESRKEIVIDIEKKTISLPGSWTTLGIVLMIFSYKYYLGYHNFLDPAFKFSLHTKLLTLFVSGVSSGILIGRSGNYVYRLTAAIPKHLD